MSAAKQIDAPLLFRLWADQSLERHEIARRLGVGHTCLSKAVKAFELPPRKRRARVVVPVDPTPEEIAARALECRQRRSSPVSDLS